VAANHGATNSTGASNEPPAAATATNKSGEGRKPGEGPKPIEVVFLLDGERAKMVPVKRGVSDDTYVEITEGLQEGQEVVSGGYKAINRELEDGKKMRKGTPPKDEDKDQKE
jgi:HlyD family secretion protein